MHPVTAAINAAGKGLVTGNGVEDEFRYSRENNLFTVSVFSDNPVTNGVTAVEGEAVSMTS